MNRFNPSLSNLKSAVNEIKRQEREAKENLIAKVKVLKSERKTEDEILTYILKNTGLDLDNARKFLKYNF